MHRKHWWLPPPPPSGQTQLQCHPIATFQNSLPFLLQMQTPFALPAQTSFESERSQQHFQSASAQDGLDSEFSDEDPSDLEQDATPRRSSRKRNATQASRDGDDQVSHTCIHDETVNLDALIGEDAGSPKGCLHRFQKHKNVNICIYTCVFCNSAVHACMRQFMRYQFMRSHVDDANNLGSMVGVRELAFL